MMHGYLAFDKDGNLLVPFRTWRNTMTEQAARELTELLRFNIPQRWSIAHLYQAILNRESHIKDISYLTTLAGYVHWKLTGQFVLGVGEASGMFPIDSTTNNYDAAHAGVSSTSGSKGKTSLGSCKISCQKSLPQGMAQAFLPKKARGCSIPQDSCKRVYPLCPPEGDAGTGMVATNSVAERTANVSAGTSVFAMIVLEKALSKVYPEIDMVTTPAGRPVAMVHCNTCTSDLNAWISLFQELTNALGVESVNPGYLKCYTKRRSMAMRIAANCWPTIIFQASLSPTLRKGARCSSVHPKAASRWRTLCVCICSRRSAR